MHLSSFMPYIWAAAAVFSVIIEAIVGGSVALLLILCPDSRHARKVDTRAAGGISDIGGNTGDAAFHSAEKLARPYPFGR